MIVTIIYISILFIFVEITINKITDKEYLRYLYLKQFIRKQLHKKGCQLKNNVFLKKQKNLAYKLNYIYNKKLNACFYDNCFNVSGNEVFYEFKISINGKTIILTFNDFYRVKDMLLCKYKSDTFFLYVTINSQLQIKLKFVNKNKQSVPIELYFKLEKYKKNIFTELKGNFKKFYNKESSQLSYKGQVLKQKTMSFKLNLFNTSLFYKLKFFTNKKEYQNIIYAVSSRFCFTNYAKFNDIVNFVNRNNLNLKNIFVINLFSHNDFIVYKKILNNLDEIKKFNVQIVVFYKNCYCKKINHIKYIDFYSDKLHIFKYLEKYYSNKIYNYLNNKKSLKNEYDIINKLTYNYLDNTQIGFLSIGEYALNINDYQNYLIKDNSILLQNKHSKIFYNFSSKVKFENGIIVNNASANTLVIADRKIKVDSLQIMLLLSKLNADKKLFINFWQEANNENEIYQNIDDSIAICQPLALIYYQNTNFSKVYENVKNVNNIVSQLILYYYLIKANNLGLNIEKLIIKEKINIIKNLLLCFGKAKVSEKAEDIVILFLHAKNLLNCNLFEDEKQVIYLVFKSLAQKVEGIYNKLKTYKTFDEIVLNLQPTFVNYEILFDYLIDIKNGLFKFKSDKCFYDNVFLLQNQEKSLNVWLQGNLLKTISTYAITLNENLYLPYDLVSLQNNIKICD